MKEVVIIGGGASGIFTALSLGESRKTGVKITIVEQLDKIGKKILATGNGRCNFTNRNLTKDNYNHPSFVEGIITKYGYDNVCSYLEKIGLLKKELDEGRTYPYALLATSFLDVLRKRLDELNVIIKTNYKVSKIIVKNNKYYLYTETKECLTADYLVFANGGMSSPKLGSNGTGYKLLSPFKVSTTPFYPGLVGLKSKESEMRPLSGIRVKCLVMLKNKEKQLVEFKENGEVLFKDDGLSGIVIMNASSYIKRMKKDYFLILDLMPEYTANELLNILITRKKNNSNVSINDFLTGMFAKMLNVMIIKRSKLDNKKSVLSLEISDLERLVNNIKNYVIEITGDYGFTASQVTVGGVSLDEVNEETLEIKKMPQAYICGELLDIDGLCGGYNLHWALASGMLVGHEISKKLTKEDTNDNR